MLRFEMSTLPLFCSRFGTLELDAYLIFSIITVYNSVLRRSRQPLAIKCMFNGKLIQVSIFATAHPTSLQNFPDHLDRLDRILHEENENNRLRLGSPVYAYVALEG